MKVIRILYSIFPGDERVITGKDWEIRCVEDLARELVKYRYEDNADVMNNIDDYIEENMSAAKRIYSNLCNKGCHDDRHNLNDLERIIYVNTDFNKPKTRISTNHRSRYRRIRINSYLKFYYRKEHL